MRPLTATPPEVPAGLRRRLAAAGLLDPDQVRSVLLAAALQAPATGHGDRERKAQARIISGLHGGAAKPRQHRDGAA